MKQGPLFLTLLLLVGLAASCRGPDLGPTGYGQSRGVDGLSVFRNLLAAEHQLVPVQGYGTSIADAHRIIYVHRQNSLPDEDFWWWLRDWLDGDERRQAMVVLRDVGTIDLMLRYWARQAYTLSFMQDTEEQARRLGLLSEMLFRMADRLQHTPPLTYDEYADRAGFHWQGITPRSPSHLYYQDKPLTVPRYLRQGHILTHFYDTPRYSWSRNWDHTESSPVIRTTETIEEVVEDEPWEPLIESNLGTLLGRWQSNQGGQLYILNGASAITDAALVDPAARDFLAAVFDSWDDGQQRQRLAWLLHAHRDSDTAPSLPGPLSALRHPGIAIISAQVLLCILALLTWRSLWVGRRRRREERESVSFHRHIVSLGRLLDSDDGRLLAKQELAAWFKQTPPRTRTSPQRDLATVQAWFPERLGSPPSPSSSPVQGHSDD